MLLVVLTVRKLRLNDASGKCVMTYIRLGSGKGLGSEIVFEVGIGLGSGISYLEQGSE